MMLEGGLLGPFDLIVIGSVFGLVLGIWFVGFFLWYIRRLRRLHEIGGRLGLTDEEKGGGMKVIRLWHDGREVTMAVPGETERPSLRKRLQRTAMESELGTRFHSLLFGLAGFWALGFLILFMATEKLLPGIGLTLALAVSFRLYIKSRIQRRAARFERQLVDSLDLAARSLRAGHPLLGAFRLIADEIPQPVSTVFEGICQRQALGMSLEDALRQASIDHASHDLRLFVTSVIIQMRSGGNLADMMERITFVIRDRLRLLRKVRTLTAQTELSKRILIALPIVMFFVLSILNPRYMRTFFTTPGGELLLVLAAVGMMFGVWIMNKITVLRY